MATIAQINADLVGSSATALAGILASQQVATQLLTSILQEVTASKVANATGKSSEAAGAGAGAPAGDGKAKDDKKDKEEETKKPPALGDIFSKGVLKDAVDKYQSGIDVAKAYSDMFGKMETSLLKFVDTGKFSFSDFTKSIIDDLVKIEMKILMSQGLQAIMGALLEPTTQTYGGDPGWLGYYMGGNGTGGYGMMLQTNASGVVYTSRDLSAYSGSVVSNPTMFAFARGAGVMGEAGPEAIMPLKRGSDGKLGVSVSGGMRGNVTVLIENHTDVQPQVSQSTGANGESIITVLMKHVDSRMTQNAANPNSSFGKAIKNTYGLQRRGVPVSGG